jgi:hypothetical protein
MGTMPPRCVVRHFDVVPATRPTRLVRPVHSFLNDGRRDGHERPVIARIDKPMPGLTFLGSHIANCPYGTLRASLPPAMAPTGRNEMGLTLHRVTLGVAEIRSVLDSLGIEAAVVASGRRSEAKRATAVR